MDSAKSGGRILWVLCAAIVCLQGQAAAQSLDSSMCPVRGKVLDGSTGEPVSEVSVSVVGGGHSVSGEPDGTFEICIPASGTCTLMVSKSGYMQLTLPVEAGEGEVALEVSLESSSLQELPKMMVNADRKKKRNDKVVSRMSIASELLKKLPNAGQADVFRSLQLLPGVSGTNETSSGLYVRGGTPDQNLVLIDGVPIYYVDHFYGFFSAFNPGAIDDVTLHKGGFGPQWGGRLSSVVELTSTGQSNKYDSDGIQTTLGTGFLSSDGFLKIPLKNNELGTIILAARRSMNDLYKTDVFSKIFGWVHGDQTLESGRKPDLYGGRDNGYSPLTYDRYTYEPEFGFWDVNGMAAFRLGSRGKLATTFFASHDYEHKTFNHAITPWLINVTDGGFTDEGVHVNIFDTIRTATTIRNREPVSWGNSCAGQKWEQQWSDAYKSSLNLSYSEFIDERSREYRRLDIRTHRISSGSNPDDSILTDDSSWESSKNRIRDMSARYDNTLRLADWNTLSAGVEVSRKEVVYDRDTIQPDTNSVDYLYQSLKYAPVRSRDTGLSVAVYAGDEMAFSELAGLSFGARLYYFDLLSSYAVDPRVSGWWKPHPDVKVKGAWGRYTQEIHRAEKEDIMGGSKFVWLLANKYRPLEKSQNSIGGIMWEKKHFLVDMEAYYKRLTGLLVISEQPPPRLPQYAFNPDSLNLYVGTGTVKGVEFMAQAKDVATSLFSRTLTYNGWVAYTWNRVENTFTVFNLGTPFPATQDRTHEVKLVSSLDLDITRWSSLNLGAVWFFATGTPYTVPLGTYRLEVLGGGPTPVFQYVSDKNRYRFPDYHRLDLSVAWNVRYSQRIQSKFTVGIFNVYDHKNVLERTYTADRIGSYGPITTTVFTPVDKLSLPFLPHAGLEISAKF